MVDIDNAHLAAAITDAHPADAETDAPPVTSTVMNNVPPSVAEATVMPQLHSPRSSYDLFVYNFPYDFFRHHRRL